MRPLFPPAEPYSTEFLQLSDGHEIYIERAGNPHGEAVLFLHGGPGSGSSPDQRRLFDPKRFNIIQFDQRGCGNSRPHGSLENNTTSDLVGDIAALLDHLKLDKVHLAGGSWGSTLALCFAVKYPDRLKSLLLYGVFLGRQSELQALYFPDGIAHQLHPELFEQYLSLLPVDRRQNPIEGYNRLFHNSNETLRNAALLMWTRLEKRLSRLVVDEDEVVAELANPQFVLSHSLIENHYFRHNCFIDGDELLATVTDRLRELPTHIIAGRYDLVCPIITAHQLHKALPHSTMSIVADAGHSFREKGITDAFIQASETLLEQAS